jgi:hypothetical protein
VGESAKSFIVHADLLTSRSIYLRDLLATRTKAAAGEESAVSEDHSDDKASTTALRLDDGELSFPTLDEFAFALFVRWLYGASLPGPTDLHTMQHYLGLYCLASTFRIERLSNECMDLVRHYYRTANITAPPYRLDFVYENTRGPCAMRRFLIDTAAYRVLVEGRLSEVMRQMVRAGGDVSEDLLSEVLRYHVEGLVDVRQGPDCAWHDHKETVACATRIPPFLPLV